MVVQSALHLDYSKGGFIMGSTIYRGLSRLKNRLLGVYSLYHNVRVGSSDAV